MSLKPEDSWRRFSFAFSLFSFQGCCCSSLNRIPEVKFTKPQSTPCGSMKKLCQPCRFSCDFRFMWTIYLRFVYTYRQSHPFFVLFKNGFNAVLWCCLHITLERSKVLLTKTVTLTVNVNKPLDIVHEAATIAKPISLTYGFSLTQSSKKIFVFVVY